MLSDLILFPSNEMKYIFLIKSLYKLDLSDYKKNEKKYTT